jgi:hypothetical protein
VATLGRLDFLDAGKKAIASRLALVCPGRGRKKGKKKIEKLS